jgi:hypothetical protein
LLQTLKNGEIAMTEQLCEGQKQNKWFPGVKASPEDRERLYGHQIFISLWLLSEIDPAVPFAYA